VGASLLNPHAILDTVGVVGVVAGSRHGLDKAWFSLGAILASLLEFSFLGAAAIAVRKRLTIRLRRAISYASAGLMAVFACLLLNELLRYV
jgi:L-lysine exporter family protein LysE/ArgO